MNDVKDTLRTFIQANFLKGKSLANLGDDAPLVSSGLLDSLSTMILVNFVERHFKVELDVYDTSIERFDRIEDIATLVTRKQMNGGAA